MTKRLNSLTKKYGPGTQWKVPVKELEKGDKKQKHLAQAGCDYEKWRRKWKLP